ncbi:MAG: hypothetical protein OEY11_08730 [Gammaproteobacteria bacterium]|nr:hypothetical protein [Gammaproteobacteria bacterium]
MTPIDNKKIAIFSISAAAVLGFGFNIYNNLDQADDVSSAANATSQRSVSQNRSIRSEDTLKSSDHKQQSSSFLAATQDRQALHNSNTDTAGSHSRDQALAQEEALANQQKCHDTTIDEVGYVTEAYNQKTLDPAAANQQILYQMQSCSRQQIGDIVKKIFSDSNDKTHAMALLLDLMPQLPRSLPVIQAIRQQDFSNDDMQALITMTKDQPTGVKQALVPSIVKNDNLDNFLALTQQDNFFSSMQQRSGSYPTDEQASNMIQGMILSQRHNIQPEGAIYNHLLDTYPNSDTYNQLTKIAFTTNQ